jgi:hypothetical protein
MKMKNTSKYIELKFICLKFFFLINSTKFRKDAQHKVLVGSLNQQIETLTREKVKISLK